MRYAKSFIPFIILVLLVLNINDDLEIIDQLCIQNTNIFEMRIMLYIFLILFKISICFTMICVCVYSISIKFEELYNKLFDELDKESGDNANG